MGFNFNLSFGNPQPIQVEHTGKDWMYWMFSSRGVKNTMLTPQQKLKVILSNPACLKVFSLNADLFSLGKINTDKQEDYLKTLRKTPNYKQNWTQFKWDYMFWNMLGTAYLWKTGGKLFNDQNTLQWLNPANLDWKPSTVQKMMDLILTKASYKDIMGETVKYSFGNGKSKYIPLSEITPLHDLSSGMNDNFYIGVSRIDALYKIIANSEEALDAKNINVRYSGKWMVSGKQDPNNINEQPLSDTEKDDIELKVNGSKQVHANKSAIDIKRFTDNMAQLKLDESYWSDYYAIGSMYGIPRDILEAYVTGGKGGSTYENQEKSIVRHIEYTLKPKGQELTDAIESIVDIEDTTMTWNHLACYQVFETERQNVVKLKLENAILAKENKLKLADYE